MVSPKAPALPQPDLPGIRRALSCANPGCRCQTRGDARYHCPAHPGDGATLSITEKDGRILVHCFAGCEGKAVVAALRERKLWPAAQAKPKQVQTAFYDYPGLNRELRFQVVRFENPKGFKQRQPDGRGDWLWNLKDVVRIPYRLPELAAADTAAVVYIPEGEKDVERLRDLGQVATCNPGGAGKWIKSYSGYLEGRHVVILPDNDDPGRAHADKVAELTAGLAASIKILELPGLPEHGDVSDWLSANGNGPDDLASLVDAAPPWTPKDAPRPEVPTGGGVYRETDVGNGRRFIAAHGNDIRWCPQWHTWLWWTGVRWESDNTEELRRRAKAVIDALFGEVVDLYRESTEAELAGDREKSRKVQEKAGELYAHARRSEGAARIGSMLEMAKSEQGVAIRPETLDADPWLINCLNGTIDLKTGTLRPHRRSELLTKLAPEAFIPNAALALWDTFLPEAIPDSDTRAYVKRCAGATIVGAASDDLLLVCNGPGGTGKGTFLNAFQNALGDYAAAAELSTFTTARDVHAPQPDLARLKGVRMVAVSEVDAGGTVSLLKRATGGDPISTRSHHQETFQFVPQFTLWIISNDRPNVPHDDSGIWRRLREIPFRTTFETPDPTIRSTLTNPEIAGEAILAWAVQGCLEWQKQGVGDLPETIRAATEEYRTDMDPLLDWIEDNINKAESMWTVFKESFANYQEWAKDNGFRYPLGRKKFAQRLADKFPPKKGAGGARGNTGLALKTAKSGIFEMPLTHEGVGYFQNNPLRGGTPTDKMPQMPPQEQARHDDEMPPSHDLEKPQTQPNATDLDPWDNPKVLNDGIGI